MSLSYLLADVIITTFLKEVGKHQTTRHDVPCAMLMSFSIPTAPDENGFRYLDVLIYGPQNYVGVYTRQRWNVIPEADLGPDDEGPLPGKDYDKGESPWTCVSYHDSGWRAGVEKILRDERLSTWSRPEMSKGGDLRGWYAIVDVVDYKLPE